MTKLVIASRAELDRKTLAFDGKDTKGRVLGLSYVVENCLFAEVAEDYAGSYYRPSVKINVGVRYRVNVQATKDGKAWGATQPDNWFETVGEAAAYVAKRTKAAKNKAEGTK